MCVTQARFLFFISVRFESENIQIVLNNHVELNNDAIFTVSFITCTSFFSVVCKSVIYLCRTTNDHMKPNKRLLYEKHRRAKLTIYLNDLRARVCVRDVCVEQLIALKVISNLLYKHSLKLAFITLIRIAS